MIIHSAKAKIIKAKRCKAPGCLIEFMPRRPMQKACSPGCALSMVAAANAKKAKAVAKADRKETKAKLEKLKSRNDWMREAQMAFNRYIRLRDEGKPCICCGQLENDEGWKPGGSWDAGHFLGRGAYPELKFDEMNCHRQLKSCNAGSSKYAKKGRTVSKGYREGLIARVGLAEVERLEGPHPAKHYTIPELQEIKSIYMMKAKGLSNG
jgi:hypothetical protein